MKDMLKSLLTSKKVWMTVLAVVSFLLGKLGLDLPADQLWLLVAPWVVLIGGQAVADMGKEAEKIRSADRATLQAKVAEAKDAGPTEA